MSTLTVGLQIMQMNDQNDVLFHEVQRFPTWLRWLIAVAMACCIVLAGYGLWSNFSSGRPASLSSIMTAFIPGLLIPVGVIVFFVFLKLETLVCPDCLCVRFFPFHISYKRFTKADLAEYHPRTYNPLREYGGWGIRCGWKGKAYNFKGNRGVQLVLTNGKLLLIGSQKADDLANALNSMI